MYICRPPWITIDFSPEDLALLVEDIHFFEFYANYIRNRALASTQMNDSNWFTALFLSSVAVCTALFLISTAVIRVLFKICLPLMSGFTWSRIVFFFGYTGRPYVSEVPSVESNKSKKLL